MTISIPMRAGQFMIGFKRARRLDLVFGGACGYPYSKFFEGTLFHEARHAYQLSLSLDGNDFDQDYLVQVIPIPADDSVPPKNYFKDSTDSRIVCYVSLDISGSRSYRGDVWPDSWDELDMVVAVIEMDAYVFASKWAR